MKGSFVYHVIVEKRRRLFLSLSGVIALSALAWIVIGAHSNEPVFRGRTLTFWLERYANASDIQSEIAIRQIGTNGIPTLLRLMTTRESPATMKLLALLPPVAGISLPDKYHEKMEQRRFLGADGFAVLADQGKSAVPALIALLDDPDTRVRVTAIRTLAGLGPAAGDAMPGLIMCLNDARLIIRHAAVQALKKIHQDPGRAIPMLTDFLRKYRTDTILCLDAIASLANYGVEAKTAIPTLTNLLNEKDASIRFAVTNALMKFDSEPFKAPL